MIACIFLVTIETWQGNSIVQPWSFWRFCFSCSFWWLHLLLVISYSPINTHSSSLTLHHVLTGYPAMPIYWAFGYHLCRWGYKTSNSTWEVVKSMRNHGIPQVKFSPLFLFSIDVFYWICFEVLTMRLLSGCPVEWFGLHGPLHGLHLRHRLCHAAWHDQGFACSRPTLCLDCGMLKFVFACNSCIVYALVYLYDINGCVSTCRIQALAAHNLRARTGLMTRGSGETSLLKMLMEKYLLGRQDFLPL